MVRIELDDVSVHFPIYNAGNRSLRSRLIDIATGGRISADRNGRMVVCALENIDLRLQDGDRIGVVGHNGAGKSTLLRLLSGVYWPTGGNVKINGTIGSLIDLSLGMEHEATGRENIYIRGGLLGMRSSEIRRALGEIIEFSGLGDFIDMPLRTYSAGMQLRLAFSVSTQLRPNILLMDEWLSVGDEEFREKARGRLESLMREAHVLVLATHSRDLLLRICNKAVWLEHGRVRMVSDARTISAAYFETSPE